MSPADGPLSWACIAGGLRTPIAHRGGALSRILPEDLGALVIRALLKRYKIAGREVCGVLAGNAVGTGGNLARLMALKAGLPEEVPAVTIDVRPGGLLSRRWDGERLTSAAAHLCGA